MQIKSSDNEILKLVDRFLIVAFSDINGVIQVANDKMCEITGYERHELVGNNFSILASGIHDQAFYEDLWTTIMSGKIWRGVICNRRKNGDSYWVDAIISPRFDDAGEMTGFLTVRNEVTKEKEYLKEMLFGERYAKFAVWRMKKGSDHLTCSENLFNLFGLDPSHDHKVPVSVLMSMNSESDQIKISNMIEALFNEGTPLSVDHEITDPHGMVRWLHCAAQAERNTDGKIVCMHGFSQDITERKISEKIVDEQRSQVIHSGRLALLGEMASGIAHEINNPLAVLLSMTEILKEDVENDGVPIERKQLLKFADKFEKSILRISKIVNGLRTFSRSEEHEKIIPMNAKSLIEDTMNLCGERIKKKGVELSIDVPEDLTFDCAPIKLSQVFVNLLNNSADAVSQSQKPWIKLIIQKVDGAVRIRVRDSGNGVNPEIRDKIMQPFFTTKGVGKGTGLGLSISQSIVEDHGGRLWLDTKDEHTSFVIDIPLHEGDAIFALDHDSAIEAHMAWRQKLSNYALNPDGSLKPEKVAEDCNCSLGKWIYMVRDEYLKDARHEALRSDHAKFHQAASEIVKRIHERDSQVIHELEVGSGSEYDEISGKVIQLIQDLKRRNK